MASAATIERRVGGQHPPYAGPDTYANEEHFLRPVAATVKDRVLYHVDRIADGRSYATRVVRATQGNQSACVYIATVAFQNSDPAGAGNVLDYGPPMPDLDGLKPTDVPADLNRKILADGSSPDSPLQPLSSEVEAFDYRIFGILAGDQRTWDLGTGRLVMTCEQEALIRLKGDGPKL
ncbi:Acyl-CoA thioesterase [Apiospora aurea]|uniref:Acyl-CoA thioesterase n=1 Tax=Apiospora aurea TaxID=335848 RepID=A0ABR1Q0M5_9PEZI